MDYIFVSCNRPYFTMRNRNKYILAGVMIILMALSYMVGYANGAKDTARIMIEMASDFVDIKLSDKAIEIIANNPTIMGFVMENQKYYNGTNPYAEHPQGAAHWERCMMINGDYDLCDRIVRSKYFIFEEE